MVNYSTISGVAKELIRNNIITKFWYAQGLSKAGLTNVIRNFIVNGGLTKRKEREDKGGSVFTCEKRKNTQFTAYKKLKKRDHEIGETVLENLPQQI